jgi:pimeloyl-ACP methyl ester carboxylesterase
VLTTSLHHEFVGNLSSQKLIIFLHQGLGSIAQWKDFPAKVCQEVDSAGLMYDRQGYGKSQGSLNDRTDHYLHEASVELEDLIEQLAVDYPKIILYGHSDGGSIALIYAAKNPSSSVAIITEAAHVIVEEITINGIQNAGKQFQQGLFAGLSKYHKNYWEVFNAWYTTWLRPSFKSWSLIHELPDVIVPQLAIQGIDDEYGTLHQLDLIEKHTVGLTKIVKIPNCGHAPHKEKEIETLTVVKAFIDGL